MVVGRSRSLAEVQQHELSSVFLVHDLSQEALELPPLPGLAESQPNAYAEILTLLDTYEPAREFIALFFGGNGLEKVDRVRIDAESRRAFPENESDFDVIAAMSQRRGNHRHIASPSGPLGDRRTWPRVSFVSNLQTNLVARVYLPRTALGMAARHECNQLKMREIPFRAYY